MIPRARVALDRLGPDVLRVVLGDEGYGDLVATKRVAEQAD